jgi:hypothetical protein
MITTPRDRTRFFVSAPTSADTFAPATTEVGLAVNLGEIGSNGVFEDYRVDQFDRPLKRRTGTENGTANILCVRDPFDEGQRFLKARTGTDDVFTFVATLDDGAESKWTFNAVVTGYSTNFSKFEENDPISVVFRLEILSDILETNNLQ